jgi:hypothetical protein
MAAYEFKLGTYAGGVGGLQLLSTLGVVWPAQVFLKSASEAEAGDGTLKGVGWSIAEWHWSYLSEAELTILRTYCPLRSSKVFVRTLNDSKAWTNYQGIMIMPSRFNYSSGKVLDVTAQFRALITP